VKINDCCNSKVIVECCFDILAVADADVMGEVSPSIHQHH